MTTKWALGAYLPVVGQGLEVFEHEGQRKKVRVLSLTSVARRPLSLAASNSCLLATLQAHEVRTTGEITREECGAFEAVCAS
ncbi:hypothetical protein D3C80_2033630 [compost metagenome]